MKTYTPSAVLYTSASGKQLRSRIFKTKKMLQEFVDRCNFYNLPVYKIITRELLELQNGRFFSKPKTLKPLPSSQNVVEVNYKKSV